MEQGLNESILEPTPSSLTLGSALIDNEIKVQPSSSGRGRKPGFTPKSKSCGKNVLTVQQRIDILNEFNNNQEEKGIRSKLAMKYGVSRGRISQILNYEKKLTELDMDPNRSVAKSRLRLSQPKWDTIENKLYDWIVDARENGNPVQVSFKAIKSKALELAEELNLPDFTASSGWYSRFIKRVNLSSDISMRHRLVDYGFPSGTPHQEGIQTLANLMSSDSFSSLHNYSRSNQYPPISDFAPSIQNLAHFGTDHFLSLKNSHLQRPAPALGDFDSLYSLTHNASHGMRPDNRMHHNNYHININSTISDSESDSSSVYESSINGYNLEDISRNMALLREQSNLTNSNTNNNGNGMNSALNNLNANNNSKGFKKIRLS